MSKEIQKYKAGFVKVVTSPSSFLISDFSRTRRYQECVVRRSSLFATKLISQSASGIQNRLRRCRDGSALRRSELRLNSHEKTCKEFKRASKKCSKKWKEPDGTSKCYCHQNYPSAINVSNNYFQGIKDPSLVSFATRVVVAVTPPTQSAVGPICCNMLQCRIPSDPARFGIWDDLGKFHLSVSVLYIFYRILSHFTRNHECFRGFCTILHHFQAIEI